MKRWLALLMKLDKTNILLAVTCLLSMQGLGQKDSTKTNRVLDSSYIKSYYQQLDFNLQFGSQFMEYRTYYNDTFFLTLRPNEIYTLAPAINYKWLSLSYTFTPEFLDFNNDDDRRGSTRYRRLSTSLSFNRLSLSGQWSSTTGFYLANMNSIDPDWRPGQSHLIFPNMNVRRFTFNGTYRMNPNFSLKAIQGGEEEQLKSAMTFLPGFNVSYFRFTVPDDVPIAGKTELMNNLDINLMLTLAGTVVLGRHAFVSAMAGPIVGIDHFSSLAFNSSQQIVRTNAVNLSSGFHFGINLGYNNPKWYVGISNYASNYRHAVNNSERMAKVFNQFSLYGGFRIRPPKYLKKTLGWVEKIIPMLQ